MKQKVVHDVVLTDQYGVGSWFGKINDNPIVISRGRRSNIWTLRCPSMRLVICTGPTIGICIKIAKSKLTSKPKDVIIIKND